MASSQNPGGPVLVQHSSPPHALSPEVTVVSISAFSLGNQALSSPLPDTVTVPSIASSPSPPGSESTTSVPELLDTEMGDASFVGYQDNPLEPAQESDLGHIPQQGGPLMDEELPGTRADITEHMDEQAQVWGREAEQPDRESSQESGQDDHSSPPPPAVLQQPRRDVPVWATWEDDLSSPTEDEMEELRMREARGSELNALDVLSIEKHVYQDVDDPDLRPVKKLRLSWRIKGVRGTQDNPNYARVMVSPVAKVDENYWQIKLYPRGNKCSSLSAYIKCSRHPPKSAADIPEGCFSFFEGPPHAQLGPGAVPSQTLTIAAGTRGNSAATLTHLVASSDTDTEKPEDSLGLESSGPSPQHEIDAARRDVTDVEGYAEGDWRVPAQLGMVIYNPEEPRTCTYMSSQHQFSKNNDDWGWTNFVGPWSDLHIRQHLQRQPLLRNDTIGIDAYIRIFDDPSQALWWHPSDTETYWDSKSLAGYYPMGAAPLYHGIGVAGMTPWLLLAPFRRIIQNFNSGQRRSNPEAPPTPFICQLQRILFLMRSLKREPEAYVDLHPLILSLDRLLETYYDVKTFWEVLRRTVELELGGDCDPLNQLSSIFDTPDGPISLPPLPVKGTRDIQQGLDEVLATAKFKGHLPNFLPLFLARDRFDANAREWKLVRDRVIMNEELDVSKYCPGGESASYTLYGFVVHVGGRNSGKFYSVLRPDGPNGKWLAFEDGDGKKVVSYTRKRVQEFEGLEGRSSSDCNPACQVAYMAMYIKTSCLSEYLPGKLEPYKLPKWLIPYLESQYQEGEGIFADDADNGDPECVDVEIYSDEGVIGREGPFDIFTLQQQCRRQGQQYVMPSAKSMTFQELRQRLAQKLGVGESEKIRLFLMRNSDVVVREHLRMTPVNLQGSVYESTLMLQPLRLWMATLTTQEEIDLFAELDSSRPRRLTEDTQHRRSASGDVTNGTEADSSSDSNEEHVAGPDAEQASVRAAVAADVARASTRIGQPSNTLGAVDNPDTPMGMDITPPTAEESLLARVPHGHLIDAALHQGEVAATGHEDGPESLQSSNSNVLRLSPPEQAIVAAVTTGGAEVVVMDLRAGVRESTETRSESSESSEPAATEQQDHLQSVYGFIQIFDMEKQSLTVRSTFSARRDSKLRDVVCRRLGWPTDKEFNVWYSVGTANQWGTATPGTAFEDDGFHDGTVVIVGEVVPDARVRELHKEGKYSIPYDLSCYLRMVDRKHPMALTTTSEDSDRVFGCDYYKGPVVNGRPHGERCMLINSGGETYEGPLVCGKKCGKGGKMTYRNGDTYDGEWDEDERHGQGTFVEHRTGNKYVGGFEYGKRWGMGTTYWQVADEQADLCQICYGEEIDALFFDCGHVCSCVECAKHCDICPICRKPVKQVVKMFRA